MDFTLKIYRAFIDALTDSGYAFLTVRESSGTRINETGQEVVLRHDVDKKPQNSLVVAQIEHYAGVRGTFYFRVTGESYNERIIREIASMGHEIGYHYEDLDLAWRKEKEERKKKTGRAGGTRDHEDIELFSSAYESLKKNLAKLRDIVPVNTICMHGSPMSRYDSRLIWKYYDYHELSVITEPYFDLSLDEMLYLTDTGRRWDGSSFAIRDRVIMREFEHYISWVRRPEQGSAMSMSQKGYDLQKKYSFRTTGQIIEALRQKMLPRKIMITIHPQRWSNSFPEWLVEKAVQGAKNQFKYLLKRYRLE